MNKQSYDIIFYYPQHFNRDKKARNSFFSPLLAICKSNNIHYLVLEEPDKKTELARNQEAIPFDIYFYIILIFRKLIPTCIFKKKDKKEQLIGDIMRKITLAKFNAKIIITLSNSMGGFWRGYNKNARIIDYQHGIIYKNHPGYFNKGQAASNIFQNNKEVAVWGKGFYDVFEKNKKYYKNKVHILGYPQLSEKEKVVTTYNKRLIFSLQFVPELTIDIKKEMLIEIKKTLNEINKLSKETKPRVLLVNHPRHNYTIDLTSLANKFNFVSIINSDELIYNQDYLLHITFYSTTCFEMAMKGIPTYFLSSKKIRNNKIFIEDYNYPITQRNSITECIKLYHNKQTRTEHGYLVKEWSKYYFQPLDADLFLEFINKT